MEKKKIIIPVVTIAVIGAVGGTGYYYRDNVIDVATEAFDVRCWCYRGNESF